MKTIMNNLKFSALILSTLVATSSAFAVTPADIQQCQSAAATIQTSLDAYGIDLDNLEVKLDDDTASWQARCDAIQNSVEKKQCNSQKKLALAKDKSDIKSKKAQISATKKQFNAKNSSCRKLQTTFDKDCAKDNRAIEKASNDIERYNHQIEILTDQYNNAIVNKDNVEAQYRQRMDDKKSQQDTLLATQGVVCVIGFFGWCPVGNHTAEACTKECKNVGFKLAKIQQDMANIGHARTNALNAAQNRIDRLAIKYPPLQDKLNKATNDYNTALQVYQNAQCPVNG